MGDAPRFAFLRWQASVAFVGALLIAATLGFTLWHSYLLSDKTATEPDAHQQRIIRDQVFSGSIWTFQKQPVPGVKVSIVLNEQLLATKFTDNAGHFTFTLDGPPQSDITVIAQKSGFQTQKLYANLGDSNFQFTLGKPLPEPRTQ